MKLTGFLESIKDLETKEAKNKLAEFALNKYDLKVKKTKTLENMILDVKEYEEANIETQEPIKQDIVETPVESVSEVAPTMTLDVSEKPDIALEKAFVPLNLTGSYLTIPYWIADWILQTPDWKNRKCPYKGSDSFINSIKYYINLNGVLTIRETRNSKYINLE